MRTLPSFPDMDNPNGNDATEPEMANYYFPTLENFYSRIQPILESHNNDLSEITM